jgi:hypothetical protein
MTSAKDAEHRSGNGDGRPPADAWELVADSYLPLYSASVTYRV